ncbi:MAG: CCA tRNA nucleotidyltransferase [Zetaproteobacteria bacterium]|nr:CCA tRNA nucleotidyltransferase [Zetaproteobacteria bacterium]
MIDSNPLATFPPLPKPLTRLAEAIDEAGGQAWLVGGFVRDSLLGITSHDYDIEVYGLEKKHLHTVAKRFGTIKETGKHFGICKLFTAEGCYDLALPRTEIKNAQGHQGFDVTPDHTLTLECATLRRDFTINAMMYNMHNQTLIDLHHGQRDLHDKILRHVSPSFHEDPLRPLRAMQFAARFQLTLAAETAALCQTMLDEAATLSRHRIWQEWRKWALAPYPEHGLTALKMSHWLSLYPMLDEQSLNPSQWQRTLKSCAHTRHLLHTQAPHFDELSTLALMFAALFSHQSQTTHAQIIAFLEAIGAPNAIRTIMIPLIENQTLHQMQSCTQAHVRHLAARLSPCSIEAWAIHTHATHPNDQEEQTTLDTWYMLARQLNIHQSKPLAIINGDMLLHAGIPTGPTMGQWLKRAYQAQLDGAFEETISAKAWIMRLIKSP